MKTRSAKQDESAQAATVDFFIILLLFFYPQAVFSGKCSLKFLCSTRCSLSALKEIEVRQARRQMTDEVASCEG